MPERGPLPEARRLSDHEQNLRDLKLIREDPGWALSMIQEARRLAQRVENAERENERLREVLEQISVNAESWHSGEEAKARALDVIAKRARQALRQEEELAS